MHFNLRLSVQSYWLLWLESVLKQQQQYPDKKEIYYSNISFLTVYFFSTAFIA